jgi:hypothetical protein
MKDSNAISQATNGSLIVIFMLPSVMPSNNARAKILVTCKDVYFLQ